MCQFFTDTAIISFDARALLAGGRLERTEGAVKTGTRFSTDPAIVGRGVCVGPRLRVGEGEGGEWTIVEEEGCEDKCVFEIYAHDLEGLEVFGRRMMELLNLATTLRGWTGLRLDMIKAIFYKFRIGGR